MTRGTQAAILTKPMDNMENIEISLKTLAIPAALNVGLFLAVLGAILER